MMITVFLCAYALVTGWFQEEVIVYFSQFIHCLLRFVCYFLQVVDIFFKYVLFSDFCLSILMQFYVFFWYVLLSFYLCSAYSAYEVPLSFLQFSLTLINVVLDWNTMHTWFLQREQKEVSLVSLVSCAFIRVLYPGFYSVFPSSRYCTLVLF